MNTAAAPAIPAFAALSDACEVDLGRARARLIAARDDQLVKDSTGNRARVAQCRAQIDAILDLYLDARRTPRSATVAVATCADGG
jgi:hypothetical protein